MDEVDVANEQSYKTPASTSPLLPLLLLSLATQKNVPRVATCFKKEYDFIVVGSGAAGSIVAARLSEDKEKTVLLLEAGHMPPLLTEVPGYTAYFPATDVAWKYKTVPQKWAAYGLKGRKVSFPLGKMLGGSSNINGMVYARGNHWNYDDWAAQGAEGWSYNDVLPYFKKLEDFHVPQYFLNGYHATGGKITVESPNYTPELKMAMQAAVASLGSSSIDINARRQTGFYDVYANLRGGQRCSTVKGYLVPAEDKTNLDIFINATVTKVLIENNQAMGVEFYHEGRFKTVRARKEVILSAGSVNTPKILMLSGVGPREQLTKLGIPVVADLPVGKNFHDHPAIRYFFTIETVANPLPERLGDPVYINKYITSRSGPLASLAGLVYGTFSRHQTVNSSTDFPTAFSYLGEVSIPLDNEGDFKHKVYKQFIEPYKDDNVCIYYVDSAQPKSRGTISISTADPFDPPLIDPNYLANCEDLEDLVDGLKFFKRILKTPPFQRISAKPFETLVPGCEQYYESEDDYLRCYTRTLLFSSYHGVGSCRMGDPNDPTTVVDPQLKVKNVQGLRVVDASIMPIIPSGNINVPTMMVAEKASDMIKEDYPSC